VARDIRVFSDETMYRKCGEIYIGEATFYFSYSTIIALAHKSYKIRRENHWGPTTGKHMRHLGCDDFKVVSDEGFETMNIQILKDAINV